MKYEHAYIAGALTTSDHVQVDIKKVYEDIEKLCKKIGMTAYVPHTNGTDPVKDPDVTPRDVWIKDTRAILKADVLIVYVGMPSLGVGAEIELARIEGTPVILWWFKGEAVSRMARGNPAVVNEVVAETPEDLYSKLTPVLRGK